MLRNRLLIALALVVLLPLLSEAQRFGYQSKWKQYRHEFTAGAGVSNFLGELGGRDQIGTDFVNDLELSETQLAFNLGYRYHIGQPSVLRLHMSYGNVSGDDALTEETFRHNRNLHFRSKIYEFSLLYEYQFGQAQQGHRYRWKGVRGRRAWSWGWYAFLGVGGFHYNPEAQVQDGTWVQLYRLNTEGQGLPGGPKDYSRWSVAIPAGLGVRYSLNRNWAVGLEGGYRKTFTDYIDDVSTEYYDRQEILFAYGPQAAYLSNPTLGELSPRVTKAGQQRGDSTDKDAYMFLTFQVYYRIKSNLHPGRKRRRSKVFF